MELEVKKTSPSLVSCTKKESWISKTIRWLSYWKINIWVCASFSMVLGRNIPVLHHNWFTSRRFPIRGSSSTVSNVLFQVGTKQQLNHIESIKSIFSMAPKTQLKQNQPKHNWTQSKQNQLISFPWDFFCSKRSHSQARTAPEQQSNGSFTSKAKQWSWPVAVLFGQRNRLGWERTHRWKHAFFKVTNLKKIKQ